MTDKASFRASLDEWIKAAYSTEDACPPPEAYLPEELAGLDANALRQLEIHAESCPACAAERDLARAFEIPESMDQAERRAVDGIAARLRPHRSRRGFLGRLGITSLHDLLRAPGLQFAAAAALILAVGLGIRSSAPPKLGAVPDEVVLRSSVVQVVSPVGETDAIPSELAWQAVEGAVEYQVTIRAVDDEILGQAASVEPRIAVSTVLERPLEPAVAYVWTVEALDANGARVALSPATRFRIGPDVGSDGEQVNR